MVAATQREACHEWRAHPRLGRLGRWLRQHVCISRAPATRWGGSAPTEPYLLAPYHIENFVQSSKRLWRARAGGLAQGTEHNAMGAGLHSLLPCVRPARERRGCRRQRRRRRRCQQQCAAAAQERPSDGTEADRRAEALCRPARAQSCLGRPGRPGRPACGGREGPLCRKLPLKTGAAEPVAASWPGRGRGGPRGHVFSAQVPSPDADVATAARPAGAAHADAVKRLVGRAARAHRAAARLSQVACSPSASGVCTAPLGRPEPCGAAPPRPCRPPATLSARRPLSREIMGAVSACVCTHCSFDHRQICHALFCSEVRPGQMSRWALAGGKTRREEDKKGRRGEELKRSREVEEAGQGTPPHGA